MSNLNIIHKKHHRIIDSVQDEPWGVGVFLKRPWIFSVSEASCTYFDFSNYCDYDLPFEKIRKLAIKELNQCIADEATKIDPDVWDEG